MNTARWAVLAVALTACGPAHKSNGPAPGAHGSAWVSVGRAGSLGTNAQYELFVPRDLPTPRRRCVIAAFEAHWGAWWSKRGILRVGRLAWGQVFVHAEGTVPLFADSGASWATTGDGQAIHIALTRDHRLTGLCRAIDTHQDPQLEGDTPLRSPPWDPARPSVVPPLHPRWVLVDQADAVGVVDAFVATQGLGCH